MKIQLRQEEVWRSQFQQNKVGIGAQRMRRLDAGQADYDRMCKSCGTGWPEAAKQCWVCPSLESVPHQAPSATYESEGITYHLRILDGKPVWFQQQDGGSQGASSGPGGSQKAADRKLVDGSNLGRPPPKTDSMDEITMADVVPLDKRVDIRQEILAMDATKIQADHRARAKVQRSLQEAEAQSFKLYHPQIDAAIKKKAALQEVLARERELAPEEAAARKLQKEIITDELLDNEMAVLAPIQEGMQSVPADEVANAGSSGLRKVNLERFREKLREQYLEGRSADAGKALTEAMGLVTEAQAANQRIQEANQAWMKKVSVWPTELQRALEKGLFCLEDLPPAGDIKEKYIPFIQQLRESRNPWKEAELLAEMPEVATVAPSKGASGPGRRGAQSVCAPVIFLSRIFEVGGTEDRPTWNA